VLNDSKFTPVNDKNEFRLYYNYIWALWLEKGWSQARRRIQKKLDNFQNFSNEASADVSLRLQNYENEDAKLKNESLPSFINFA